MRLKNLHWIVLHAFILAFLFSCSQPQENQASHRVVFDADESLHGLGIELQKFETDSTEYQRITRQIAKVRSKAHQTKPKAKDPGAFIEALAAIKTGFNGEKYPANYKKLAREKSRQNSKRVLPLLWKERGPGNVAGRTRAIVVDAADPSGNTWLIATVGGGIWKTTNAGSTWQNKTAGLATLTTTSLVQCTSQPSILYAGTGMGYGRIVDLEGSGLWKSVDGGDSWSQLASTTGGELFDAINRVVVDPSDPDLVVLCANNQFSSLSTSGGSRESGIFRSTDGGLSWTQVFDSDAVFGTTTDNRVQQIVADPDNFQNLYATVNEVGVIKSVDAGLSWTVSANNFALANDIGVPSGGGFGLAGISVRTEMAISPSDPSRLYAAVERPRSVADLYMSSDAGLSWQLVVDTTGDPNWFNAFGASGSTAYTAGWFDNTIMVHPFDSNVVFVGGVNLYRIKVNASSKTRASTAIAWWIPNSSGISVAHADHHFLVAIPGTDNNFRILDANDGGVAYSTNGGSSWLQLTGMGTTQFYGADKKPGSDVYIGGMQDNGTWRSGLNPSSTTPWSFQIGGDGFEVAWHGSDPNLLLGGSQFGNLSRSTDGGNTWQSIPNSKAGNSPFISKIANVKTDPDMVFTVGDTGVKRSDDFGASWTHTNVNGPWLGYRPFDNVEISIAEPQNVWISSSLIVDPASNSRGGIYRSQDGGMNFDQVDQFLPAGLTESSGIATHPIDAATAYLLFSAPASPKVLRTTDLGIHWQDLSAFSGAAKSIGGVSANGFPDVAVFSLLVMPFNPNEIWVGTEIGLFISTDAGLNWVADSSSLPNVAIFEMKIVEGQVVIATQGRGVWSADLIEMDSWIAPMVTRVPRLNSLSLLPSGDVAVKVDLRSPYDQTRIFVNGSRWQTLDANTQQKSIELLWPVSKYATVNATVISTKDGRDYISPQRSVFAFPLTLAGSYFTDFNDFSEMNNWMGSGFSIRTNSEFTLSALHGDHPYAPAVDKVLQLTVPIQVSAANPMMSYRDVCLVEPGVPGVTDWRDANFFDYVIVEGSRDGSQWLALAPGYDCTFDAAWLSKYNERFDSSGNSSAIGKESLMREHLINLSDVFDVGEKIFIRFRLHSDPSVVGWGWVVDDLLIQDGGVGILHPEEESSLPELGKITALNQNYPNPFNPSTEISFSLAKKGTVNISIYDLRGRRVRTLVSNDIFDSGEHSVAWNGKDESGKIVSAGTYLYMLKADNRSISRKMLLVK